MPAPYTRRLKLYMFIREWVILALHSWKCPISLLSEQSVFILEQKPYKYVSSTIQRLEFIAFTEVDSPINDSYLKSLLRCFF